MCLLRTWDVLDSFLAELNLGVVELVDACAELNSLDGSTLNVSTFNLPYLLMDLNVSCT